VEYDGIMKVGDLIVGDPDKVIMIRGYEFGLIISEKSCDTDDPYESQFRVIWDCGKISYPSRDYLEGCRVVNAGG
jgi:hypothetical protein